MAGDGGGGQIGRLSLGAVGFGLGSMIGMPGIGAVLGMGIGGMLWPPKNEKKVRHIKSVLGTSSVEGTPLAVIFGRVRIGGTLLWKGSLIYHEVTEEQESGGKGGNSSTVVTDAWYTISFAMVIGEGPIALQKIYEGKNVVSPSYTFYAGTEDQIADSFLTSQTGKSIPYKHTSYIVFQNYRIGSQSTIPQLTFEVTRGKRQFDVSLTVTDTDSVTQSLAKSGYIELSNVNNFLTPAFVIKSLIKDDRIGAGFSKTVNWLDANTDCIAENYFFNLAITERRDLASLIEVVGAHGWIMTLFSGSDINLLLAKNTTPTKSLYLDDMVGKGTEQVITVSESGKSERFNRLAIEYTDPEKEYSVRPVQVEDLADQQDRGIKKNSASLLGFTDPDVVKNVGFKMLRNSLFGKRIVSFSLGPKYLSVEPGDLCYLNAGTVGLSLTRCRIMGVDETEEFNLVVTAREEPNYIFDPTDYSVPVSLSSPLPVAGVGLSNAIDFNIQETPKELQLSTGNVEMMVLYAKQHENTIGYNIYSSVDDSTYNLQFQSRQSLPYGTLDSNIGKDSWLDDTDITINTSSGNVSSVFSTISRANVMSSRNLVLVDDELMLHQTSTLGTTNSYTLDNFVRNRYNTLSKAHTSGSGLMHINNADRFEFLKTTIGVKYYFKAVPVNIDNTEGSLSEVTAVGITVQGWAYRPYRPGSVWMEESGINQRGKSRTNDRDISIGWDLVDKQTGFGKIAYNSGTYGMYTQDVDYTSSEVDVVVGLTVVRMANVGLTQSYTYTEAFNISDNTTLSNNVTFRVYTKSIYGRSRDYNEKEITIV